MGRLDCDGGGTDGVDEGDDDGERWPVIQGSTDGDEETADPKKVLLRHANEANHCCCCTTVAVVVAVVVVVAVAAAAVEAVAGNGWRKMRADEPTRASTADGNCRNCH